MNWKRVADAVVLFCIVLTTIAIVISVYGRIHAQANQKSSFSNSFHAGQRFNLATNSLPGTDTVVLAVRHDCKFCTLSMAFYRELLSKAATKQPRIQVIAVSQDPIAITRSSLQSNGLGALNVQQVSFRELGINVTPTLVILDGSGVVRSSWTGMLDAQHQCEVLKSLSLTCLE